MPVSSVKRISKALKNQNVIHCVLVIVASFVHIVKQLMNFLCCAFACEGHPPFDIGSVKIWVPGYFRSDNVLTTGTWASRPVA
jgi:hypothetical protein